QQSVLPTSRFRGSRPESCRVAIPFRSSKENRVGPLKRAIRNRRRRERTRPGARRLPVHRGIANPPAGSSVRKKGKNSSRKPKRRIARLLVRRLPDRDPAHDATATPAQGRRGKNRYLRLPSSYGRLVAQSSGTHGSQYWRTSGYRVEGECDTDTRVDRPGRGGRLPQSFATTSEPNQQK